MKTSYQCQACGGKVTEDLSWREQLQLKARIQAKKALCHGCEQRIGQLSSEGLKLDVPKVESTREKCDHCGGTGTYSWGAVVNGKPTHSGKCFQCVGKGYQTEADQKRNAYYDEYVRAS